MASGTLFIQPHSDDICMSAVTFIEKKFYDEPYYLCTVFSKSDWLDPVQKRNLFGSTNLTTEEITEIRLSEDRNFAKRFNMKFDYLDLKDSKLRNGKAIFKSDAPYSADEYKEAYNRLSIFIKKLKPGLIITSMPSGRKQHIDHRITFDISKELCKIYNIRHVLVDDIPYSRIPKKSIKRHRLNLIEVSTNGTEKNKILSIYSSQVCKLFREKILKITKLNKNKERAFFQEQIK